MKNNNYIKKKTLKIAVIIRNKHENCVLFSDIYVNIILK